jgi:hypothetical protein
MSGTSVIYLRVPVEVRSRLDAYVRYTDGWPKVTLQSAVTTFIVAGLDRFAASLEPEPVIEAPPPVPPVVRGPQLPLMPVAASRRRSKQAASSAGAASKQPRSSVLASSRGRGRGRGGAK